MSECVSYQAEVVQETARQSLVESFSQSFRDFTRWSSETWLSAEERESALQQSYRNFLSSQAGNSLSQANGSSETALSAERIRGMLHALQQTPNLLAHLWTEGKQDWESWHHEVQPLLTLPLGQWAEETAKRAVFMETRLREMIAQSHRALADAEVRFTTKILAHTLHDLGYRVDQRGQSLRATQGATCLWAQVSPKGGVTLDMSGLSGLQCLRHFQEVEQALEQQGLKLRRQKSDTHGRPEGGQLAQTITSFFELPRSPESEASESCRTKRKAKQCTTPRLLLRR